MKLGLRICGTFQTVGSDPGKRGLGLSGGVECELGKGGGELGLTRPTFAASSKAHLCSLFIRISSQIEIYDCGKQLLSGSHFLDTQRQKLVLDLLPGWHPIPASDNAILENRETGRQLFVSVSIIALFIFTIKSEPGLKSQAWIFVL